VHLHGVTGDINANGTSHTMRVPIPDAAVGVTRADKAVRVAAMTSGFTSAKTRYVLKHVGSKHHESLLGTEGPCLALEAKVAMRHQ